MGFFSRLGSRISSGIHSAARIGKKTLGNVARVGNRISASAEKVVNAVERIPILGQMAAPVTGVVRSGIGLVKDVSQAAQSGKELIEEGEAVLSGSGNVKDLVASGKSKLERAKNIKSDAKELMDDVKKLSRDIDSRQMMRDAKAQAQERMGM